MDYVGHAKDVHTSRWVKGGLHIAVYDGGTPDISEYLDFGLYDHVSYKNDSVLGMTYIGRWILVSHRVGRLVSYWILTQKGTLISITMVQCITSLEKET